MRADDDDLAAVVQSYSFQLLRPETGELVAELEADTDTYGDHTSLTMLHGDDAWRDSELRWSQYPDPDFQLWRQETALYGPALAGTSDTETPAVVLTAYEGGAGSFARLSSGGSDGAGSPKATVDCSALLGGLGVVGVTADQFDLSRTAIIMESANFRWSVTIDDTGNFIIAPA